MQWKRNECCTTCLCICGLRYPACLAHEPYCHVVCPALQYFSTLSHKRHDFRKKKLLNIKSVFRGSPQLLYEIFFILRRIQRDMIENVYWFSCKVPFIFVRFLMKVEFSRQILEKYPNIKFHENSSSESRIV